MTRASWKYCVCGVALLVLAGCQGGTKLDTVRVSGTVTLDGEPVAGASVAFKPKAADGRAAVGKTGAKGEFTLTTLKAGDGALAGSYAVTITKIETPEGETTSQPPAGGGSLSPEEKLEKMKKMGQANAEKLQKTGGRMPRPSNSNNLLPEKYASPETSGFTADVKTGEKNDFPFAMTSK